MFELRKALVAYDASGPAERAFEAGLDLARRYGAELIVLSVARPPEPPEIVETEASLDSAREYYESCFAKLREAVSAAGVQARFLARVGHPADLIIRVAAEEGVDMIVMGHRGKGFIERWLLGSISKRVATYATCTVCIVR